MPFFPNMPNHQLVISPSPTTSIIQSLNMAPIASTSTNGVDKNEAMMQMMMQNIDKKLEDQEKMMEDNFSMVQKMSNESVTIKRQQAQSSRPPQPHPTQRPPNKGQVYTSYNQNRPINNTPIANVSTNPNKPLVPQKNLAQEKDLFPSYNYSYGYCVCQREEISQALVTQEKLVEQKFNAH